MKIFNKFNPCILCNNPICKKACDIIKLDEILFNLKFGNIEYVCSILPENNPCIKCTSKCSKACILENKIDFKSLISSLYEIKGNYPKTQMDYSKLSIDFFGKKTTGPFFMSSSIIGSSYDKCARAFEAGWDGVSLKTITYIPIKETSPRYEAIKDNQRMTVFKNIEQLSQLTVEQNVQIIKDLKKNYPNKIIIASMMARDAKEWQKLALILQQAGADALELNFSCPNMELKNVGSDIGQIPKLVYKYTKAVKKVVNIPVLAKLTPNVANMSPAAEAAIKAGADGLAAINTIKSLIISNKEKDDCKISVGGLSGMGVKPIALRFVNEIKQNPQTRTAHLSAMGGIYTSKDALDFIRLGANSLQVTTAIMEYGNRIIKPLKAGLLYYLESHNYKSLNDLVGNKLTDVLPLDKQERMIANLPQFDRNKCIGCGRCIVSCLDGAHEALKMGPDNKPIMDPKKCEGCHLCINVCPNNAICPSKITIKHQD